MMAENGANQSNYCTEDLYLHCGVELLGVCSLNGYSSSTPDQGSQVAGTKMVLKEDYIDIVIEQQYEIVIENIKKLEYDCA